MVNLLQLCQPCFFLCSDSGFGGVCGGVFDGAEGPAVAAAGQDLLAVEGALLHPDGGLPAVLQEGHQPHHRDGRFHLQDQTHRGEDLRQKHATFCKNETMRIVQSRVRASEKLAQLESIKLSDSKYCRPSFFREIAVR